MQSMGSEEISEKKRNMETHVHCSGCVSHAQERLHEVCMHGGLVQRVCLNQVFFWFVREGGEGRTCSSLRYPSARVSNDARHLKQIP